MVHSVTARCSNHHHHHHLHPPRADSWPEVFVVHFVLVSPDDVAPEVLFLPTQLCHVAMA